MLYFRMKPDPVFQAILHEALESELQEITRISTENDPDAWEAGFGKVSESFTPYSALVTIEQLLIASHKDVVYRLSDYHSLLIYECLKNYCTVHQDLAAQAVDQCQAISDYRLREINFQEMVDLYFWDTDFLLLSESNPTGLHCPGYPSFDIERLTAGLQPHPMHLKLTPVNEPLWQVTEPYEFFQEYSRHYPDFG